MHNVIEPIPRWVCRGWPFPCAHRCVVVFGRDRRADDVRDEIHGQAVLMRGLPSLRFGGSLAEDFPLPGGRAVSLERLEPMGSRACEMQAEKLVGQHLEVVPGSVVEVFPVHQASGPEMGGTGLPVSFAGFLGSRVPKSLPISSSAVRSAWRASAAFPARIRSLKARSWIVAIMSMRDCVCVSFIILLVKPTFRTLRNVLGAEHVSTVGIGALAFDGSKTRPLCSVSSALGRGLEYHCTSDTEVRS